MITPKLKFTVSEQFNLLNEDFAIIDDDLELDCFLDKTESSIAKVVSNTSLDSSTISTRHPKSLCNSSQCSASWETFPRAQQSASSTGHWLDFISRSQNPQSNDAEQQNLISKIPTQKSLPQHTLEEMFRMVTAFNAASVSPKRSMPNIVTVNSLATLKAEQENNAWKHSTFFPQQMYDALQDHEMQDIARWSPNGNSFAILDKDQFVKKLMERYFPTNKSYHSFTRRLNRWGFFKNNAMFSHPMFRRDEPALLKQIRPRPNISRNRPKKTRQVTA